MIAGAEFSPHLVSNGVMNKTMNFKILCKEKLQLASGGGVSLADLENQRGLMASHRHAIEQLSPIPETLALEFFTSVGVSSPMRIKPQNIDKVFSNMRSIASMGPSSGELVYLGLEPSYSSAKAALYVHHVDASGYESGLAVCKLPDGMLLAYNDGRIGGKIGVGTSRDCKPRGTTPSSLPETSASGECSVPNAKMASAGSKSRSDKRKTDELSIPEAIGMFFGCLVGAGILFVLGVVASNMAKYNYDRLPNPIAFVMMVATGAFALFFGLVSIGLPVTGLFQLGKSLLVALSSKQTT